MPPRTSPVNRQLSSLSPCAQCFCEERVFKPGEGAGQGWINQQRGEQTTFQAEEQQVQGLVLGRRGPKRKPACCEQRLGHMDVLKEQAVQKLGPRSSLSKKKGPLWTLGLIFEGVRGCQGVSGWGSDSICIFFGGLHLWHMEVPRSGIEPAPQQ